jgi:hypothetical protein
MFGNAKKAEINATSYIPRHPFKWKPLTEVKEAMPAQKLNTIELLFETAALLPEQGDYGEIRQAIMGIAVHLRDENSVENDLVTKIILTIKSLDPAAEIRKLDAKYNLERLAAGSAKIELAKKSNQFKMEIEKLKTETTSNILRRLTKQYYKKIYEEGEKQGYEDGLTDGRNQERETALDEAFNALNKNPSISKKVFSHRLFSLDRE